MGSAIRHGLLVVCRLGSYKMNTKLWNIQHVVLLPAMCSAVKSREGPLLEPPQALVSRCRAGFWVTGTRIWRNWDERPEYRCLEPIALETDL
jgi:hypothetical protein